MFLGEGFEFTFLNLLMGVHTLLLGFILMIENLLKMFEDIFLFSLSLSELIRSLKNCPGLRSMFWVVSQKLLYFSKVETLGVQGVLALFFNIYLALLGLSWGRQDLGCLL